MEPADRRRGSPLWQHFELISPNKVLHTIYLHPSCILPPSFIHPSSILPPSFIHLYSFYPPSVCSADLYQRHVTTVFAESP